MPGARTSACAGARKLYAKDLLDRLPRDRAGPQQYGGALTEGHDRRLQPGGGAAAVQDHVDLASKIFGDMRRGHRAHMAGAVGRRRRDRPAERRDQRLRDRMRGNPNRDARQAGPGKFANRPARRGGRDDRQRPRPEGRGETQRQLRQNRLATRGFEIGDMRDQRIERGAVFGVVDPGDRPGLRRVGAEAIDGLGRKGDQPALAQDRRGASNRRGVSRRNNRHALRPLYGGLGIAICASRSAFDQLSRKSRKYGSFEPILVATSVCSASRRSKRDVDRRADRKIRAHGRIHRNEPDLQRVINVGVIGDGAVEYGLSIFVLADLQIIGVRRAFDAVAGGVDHEKPERPPGDLTAEQQGHVEADALRRRLPLGVAHLGPRKAHRAPDELRGMQHVGRVHDTFHDAALGMLDPVADQIDDALRHREIARGGKHQHALAGPLEEIQLAEGRDVVEPGVGARIGDHHQSIAHQNAATIGHVTPQRFAPNAAGLTSFGP